VNKNNIESLKGKQLSHGSTKSQLKEKIVKPLKPLKKVILPEDNDEFKVINNYCVLLFLFVLICIYICVYLLFLHLCIYTLAY